jgi:hypothetical protein
MRADKTSGSPVKKENMDCYSGIGDLCAIVGIYVGSRDRDGTERLQPFVGPRPHLMAAEAMLTSLTSPSTFRI